MECGGAAGNLGSPDLRHFIVQPGIIGVGQKASAIALGSHSVRPLKTKFAFSVGLLKVVH